MTENVAKREDNFPAFVNFEVMSDKYLQECREYEVQQMQKMQKKYQLSDPSDVMKAVMNKELSWKEYDTRLEKLLQDLGRKKKELLSDIRLVEYQIDKTRLGERLSELIYEKMYLSSDIELLQKYRNHVKLS